MFSNEANRPQGVLHQIGDPIRDLVRQFSASGVAVGFHTAYHNEQPEELQIAQQTIMESEDQDDWQEIWSARTAALEDVLGPSLDSVYHAPIPFALGGTADVMIFDHHLEGMVYVTAELTGKPDADYEDYELMICHRTPNDWGPKVISQLAAYTKQAYIGAGQSMDIDSATPPQSRIKAFLFDTYASFTLFGQENELRLCIGITKPELEFLMEHGPERLIGILKQHEVYPFTDLDRDSVALIT